MDITRQNIANLTQGFKTNFMTGFAGVTPTWPQVATETNSTTAEEVYAWLNAFPRMREWIGSRVIRSLSQSQYKIRNRPWEDTVSLPVDAVEDDQYGIYAKPMEGLGQAAAEHPDELVWKQLADGFTGECFDGQAFFDVDHPVGDKAKNNVVSVSNMQAGAGPAWFLIDSRRPLKPIIFQKRKAVQFVAKTKVDDDNVFFDKELIWGADARYATGYGFWQVAFGSKADLTSDNFNAARTAMMQFTNDEGGKLGIKPTHLVIGPSLGKKARALLTAEYGANGASNVDKGLVDVIESPWLD
jgi:phage major head subunit gpT-like protein